MSRRLASRDSRRRSRRRSSSVSPPHIPYCCPVVIADTRHAVCTGQQAQIFFASVICASAAGPAGQLPHDGIRGPSDCPAG
jgi:hypothetical protein